MTQQEALYISIAQSLKDTVQSQMFGKPCFKIGNKAFVCFFQNEMVFKLSGDIHTEALRLDGSQLFDPSGKKRPMKEWVQVSYDHKEKWTAYAVSALRHVSSS
ncbi:hypothetical protein LZQ00_10310 [Sphingobacterium sp. SRCM116780]|uniref:hypothetical protein n=1 Tax=Sphingobacterium sp. SRCM116780 TaxID=2907623 RepID=UPI001F171704|nr:hypothetical protein [Sphingobacterium sp. SRCM116780]UIR54668.1 hypothetical protein LZQ00_10310 [Sphingobacterium sp. SRCM116780]